MNIIIDTHIFLWGLSEPSKLNSDQRTNIQSLSNTIYVSAISIAEIMIKASIGKLEINFDPVDLAIETGFKILDFKGQEALLLKEIPFHHKDPFDRMIIAQSITYNYPIITNDIKFASYSCHVL